MSVPVPTPDAGGWVYRVLVVAFLLRLLAIPLVPIALIVLL